jgi:hypothetical protein
MEAIKQVGQVIQHTPDARRATSKRREERDANPTAIHYLSEEGGSIHLPKIYRLAHKNTADADEKLEWYFLEGSRLTMQSQLEQEGRLHVEHHGQGRIDAADTKSEFHLRYAISLPGPKGLP